MEKIGDIMSKYNQLGFYTGDDIFAFAKEHVIGEGFQKIIDSLRNKDKVIVVRYTESGQDSPETNYTPEFFMKVIVKVYAHVEANIYTDSKEYLHMIKAKIADQPMELYLDGVLAQIEESQRMAKEQEENLEVNENRIVE